MSLEEAILDRVRRLPPVQQEEVLRFAASLQQPIVPATRPRGRESERKWVAEHRSDFVNQWVAVEDGRLIAAGPDPLKLYEAARAEGIASPFVVHVVPDDAIPFVPGW